MIGIIWYYENKDQAFELLKKIQRGYENLNIGTKIRATKTNIVLYGDNEDIWSIYPARPSSRGHKCNISYIEYGTPEEIIATLIRPCTIAYPYGAFNYYGGPTDGIDS